MPANAQMTKLVKHSHRPHLHCWVPSGSRTQCLTISPHRNSSRIVCFSLMVVGLLVSTYYNAATMTALLSESPPSIKSLDQFLRAKIPINLINATYSLHHSGRQRIFYPKVLEKVEKEQLRILNMNEGLQSILKGESFTAEDFLLFDGIKTYFKDDEKCSLTIFAANVIFTGMRFIKKDAHLLEMYTRGLIRTIEHGLAPKKKSDWVAAPPTCNRGIPFIHVKLESVSVALGTFFAGFVLSIILFIWELMYHRKREKKNKTIHLKIVKF